jgi:hypothetical protein
VSRLLVPWVAALAALAAATPLVGQLSRPPEWRVRFDRPPAGAPDSAIEFVGMPPGWHITTTGAAILYDPAMRAAGSYRVEYEAFLFPGTALGGHGVLVGGRELDAPTLSYVALIVSRDGRFAVARRQGTVWDLLVPWTRDTAVVAHPGGNATAKNVLAVDVDADSLGFLVNGSLLARTARPADLGDLVGLRVADSLNLHVTKVSVMWGGRRRR